MKAIKSDDETATLEESRAFREYTEALIMNSSMASAALRMLRELNDCVTHNIQWIRHSDNGYLDEEGTKFIDEKYPEDPLVAELAAMLGGEVQTFTPDAEPAADLASFDANKVPKLN